MSYLKIIYESNTIEGLKAIQESFLGRGTNASDSITSETSVPPPPPQPDNVNTDTFRGVVQAPPTTDESDADRDFSNDVNTIPPPPDVPDLAGINNDFEGEIPPPPHQDMMNQEGSGEQPDEGFVPPKQSASKSQKENKKSSK